MSGVGKAQLALWALAPLGALAALFGAWVCARLAVRRAPEPAGGGGAEPAAAAEPDPRGLRAYLAGRRRAALVALGAVFLLLETLAYVFEVLPGAAPFAFLTGGLFSMLACRLSRRWGLGDGPGLALLVYGLGLLELVLWFAGLSWLFPRLGWESGAEELARAMLGCALGAALQGWLARGGGGAFARAGGLWRELTGGAEAGLSADDPRHPAAAVAAAGRQARCDALAADLYAARSLALVAAGALGIAAAPALIESSGLGAPEAAAVRFAALTAPMVVAGLGALLAAAAVVGFSLGSPSGRREPNAAGEKGLKLAGPAAAALAAGVLWLAFPPQCFGLWGAVVAGAAAGALMLKAGAWYAEADYRPARALATGSDAASAGALTGLLRAGLGAAWVPPAGVAAGALVAYGFAGGGWSPKAGFFGVGLAAVGLVSTMGLPAARGALGVGAAGWASLAALLAAACAVLPAARWESGGAALVAGALVGALGTYLFAAAAARGAARAGADLFEEIRRQLKTVPGLLEGRVEARADAEACARAAARPALGAALTSGLVAAAAPFLAGLLLGPAGLIGLAAGALVAGVPLAAFMTAAGAAWAGARELLDRGRPAGRGGAAGAATAPAAAADSAGRMLGEVCAPAVVGLMQMTAIGAAVAAGLTAGYGNIFARLAGP